MVSAKFREHLSVVLDRVSVYLEIAQNKFARAQKNAEGKLKAVRRRSESDLEKLRARSHDSFIVATEIFARLRTQASSVSRRAAVHLQNVREVATGLGRASVDKVQKLRHKAENDLRKLRAGFRVAIVASETKIRQLGGRVSSVSGQATGKLQKAQDSIIALGRAVADKPRRMREVRLRREKGLRKLLASSPEAIVVTDHARRLVAANAKALELFGISEFNMGNFTVDAFLAKVELPDFDWTDSSDERREVRGSRCKIRRLDGGLRLAECQFVAGIVSRRHLYKFLNVASYKITPPRFSTRNGSTDSRGTAETSSNSVPSALLPAIRPRRRTTV